MILTNQAFTNGLQTVGPSCHVVFELRQIPPFSSCSSDEVSATKRQATTCTQDERAGETAGDEVYLKRNGGDETAATKRPAPRADKQSDDQINEMHNEPSSEQSKVQGNEQVQLYACMM